jgi:hypothetical protein
MKINISNALIRGGQRISSRNGLLFIVGYTITSILFTASFFHTLSYAVSSIYNVDNVDLEPAISRGQAIGILWEADVPLPVSTLGILISLTLIQYITIVAMRTFYMDRQWSIPKEYYTEDIIAAFFNLLAGGILLYILFIIVEIVTPFLFPSSINGLILISIFMFMPFYIAIENKNFIDSLKLSLQLTKEHWIRLFGLVVALIILTIVFHTASMALVSNVVYLEGTTMFLSQLFVFIATTYTVAVITDAFAQLRSNITSVS